jgi:hypothetical protein
MNIDVDKYDSPRENYLNTKVKVNLEEERTAEVEMYFSTYQMEREEDIFNFGIENLDTKGYFISEVIQKTYPK